MIATVCLIISVSLGILELGELNNTKAPTFGKSSSAAAEPEPEK